MKILFTGGGTGGHFYPILAVIESLKEISAREKIIDPELFYVANSPYDQRVLFDNGVIFKKITAGKIRRYFSIMNFFDLFKTLIGVIKAFFVVFNIFPDVIFSKGGYVSFPVLIWAKLLRIPVVIHESDVVPGRVNLWSSKFAQKIAVSWNETVKNFPIEKTAWTGNPIRKRLGIPLTQGAMEYLKLEENVSVILILGGSQGAQRINETIIDALPLLISKYQIIHQTGRSNYKDIKNYTDVFLKDNQYKERYKPFDYMNELALRMAVGASSLVISRAGSTIFEIASWEKPSIIIPIPESVSHDQTKNALAYARSGSCLVMEEINLKPNILVSEIDRLMQSSELRRQMAENAKNFAKKDAAEKIATVLLDIALEHEK